MSAWRAASCVCKLSIDSCVLAVAVCVAVLLLDKRLIGKCCSRVQIWLGADRDDEAAPTTIPRGNLRLTDVQSAKDRFCRGTTIRMRDDSKSGLCIKVLPLRTHDGFISYLQDGALDPTLAQVVKVSTNHCPLVILGGSSSFLFREEGMRSRHIFH